MPSVLSRTSPHLPASKSARRPCSRTTARCGGFTGKARLCQGSATPFEESALHAALGGNLESVKSNRAASSDMYASATATAVRVPSPPAGRRSSKPSSYSREAASARHDPRLMKPDEGDINSAMAVHHSRNRSQHRIMEVARGCASREPEGGPRRSTSTNPVRRAMTVTNGAWSGK